MCNLPKWFKRRMLLLTGAGVSIPFGYKSTQTFTQLIEANFKTDPVITSNSRIDNFYDEVIRDLKNYFINPGNVTFENIYQAIQDVMVLINVPNDPKAFDEFRPHVGATHELKNHYRSYSYIDTHKLQSLYIDNLLKTFLDEHANITNTAPVKKALEFFERKFVLNSFTLNYDDLIYSSINSPVTGFVPGPAPRTFNQNLLLSAVRSKENTHCHLHGSLKWGYPVAQNPFELHEYDSPADGVKASKSRPSGRPAQKGETIPSCPIITGMDKTELVFRKPFYSNFLAFFNAFELTSKLFIAGYGFSDRHVNFGIEQCRINRPNVGTYIIDYEANDEPTMYIDRLSPDAWRCILPGQASRAKSVPKFDGWWKIPGINEKSLKTGPIFLWLRGFDLFCNSLSLKGFPQ